MRLAVAILAVLLLFPCKAEADELAAAGNVLLVVQAADTFTTQDLLHNVPGTFERDPLAKPFTHSNVTASIAAVAVNVLARVLFRHSPKTLYWLAGADAFAVGNNIRILQR